MARGEGTRSDHRRAGVATRKRRRRGLANLQRRVATHRWSTPPKQSFDALVHDHALSAEQRGESYRLNWSPQQNGAADANDVPQQAPVAEVTRGEHDSIHDRIAPEAIEEGVDG